MSQYSITQNYLTNISLISKLVSDANFQKSDLVLDLGAGKGVITRELLKYSDNVVAIEIDRSNFDRLRTEFKACNVRLENIDILPYNFPKQEYSIFANIPFNITSEIVSKILSPESKLKTAYLILQDEAIDRIMGENGTTLVSVVYRTRYQFEVVHRFNTHDFNPKPNVDISLLKITKLENPLLSEAEITMFYDFVAYIFNRSTPTISQTHLFTKPQLERFKKDINVGKDEIPRFISFDNFLSMFKIVKMTDKIELTKGYYQKIVGEKGRIEKINRTRKDLKWRYKG